MWGPHTFDRSADSRNTKLKKFNSKFWCPDIAAVDAFSQDWSKDNNYLVLPIHLIAEVIYNVICWNARCPMVAFCTVLAFIIFALRRRA